MPLTDAQVRIARYNQDGTGNCLSDGGHMYLQLDKSGAKYWRMNYRFAGKTRHSRSASIWTFHSPRRARSASKCERDWLRGLILARRRKLKSVPRRSPPPTRSKSSPRTGWQNERRLWR